MTEGRFVKRGDESREESSGEVCEVRRRVFEGGCFKKGWSD